MKEKTVVRRTRKKKQNNRDKVVMSLHFGRWVGMSFLGLP